MNSGGEAAFLAGDVWTARALLPRRHPWQPMIEALSGEEPEEGDGAFSPLALDRGSRIQRCIGLGRAGPGVPGRVGLHASKVIHTEFT